MQATILTFVVVGGIMIFIGVRFLLSGVEMINREVFKLVAKVSGFKVSGKSIFLSYYPEVTFKHPKTEKKTKMYLNETKRNKDLLHKEIDVYVFIAQNGRTDILTNKHFTNITLPSIFIGVGIICLIIAANVEALSNLF